MDHERGTRSAVLETTVCSTGQLAWSNQKLIRLAEQFVPCADEVWRLQNGKDFECELFRRFCDLGHYSGKKSTRQGVYVVTPSGRFLGSINSRNVDRLEGLMREALSKWAALSPNERRLDAAERERLESLWRWSQGVSRGRTRARGFDARLASIGAGRPRRWSGDSAVCQSGGVGTAAPRNRDYAWFRSGEAARWLPPGTAEGRRYLSGCRRRWSSAWHVSIWSTVCAGKRTHSGASISSARS